MARARNQLIDLDATSYYHIVSRCVRRAFLCGEDKYSGKNYDHRRQWVLDKLIALSEVFSIDIAAYAIMSNHYHLVLHVDKEQAMSWSDDEVIDRWYRLHRGHPLIDRYVKNTIDDSASLEQVATIIQVWRLRLFDISWFMRHLNESIARAANKEDNCKGRYWEGRYYSQALLDEQALLSCMVYVDLNPIRAGVTQDLITSDFTSIQARINSFKQQDILKNSDIKKPPKQPSLLMRFGRSTMSKNIPFTLYDYLELADWSARAIVPKKLGSIRKSTPKLLDSLGIEQSNWIDIANHFRRHYGNFAGSKERLRQCANAHDHCWYKGVG